MKFMKKTVEFPFLLREKFLLKRILILVQESLD
jgi:hypothetical protein